MTFYEDGTFLDDGHSGQGQKNGKYNFTSQQEKPAIHMVYDYGYDVTMPFRIDGDQLYLFKGSPLTRE